MKIQSRKIFTLFTLKLFHFFHLLTSFHKYSNVIFMLATQLKKLKEETDLETLAKLAIEAAVSSNWKQAEKINKKIISLDESDVEALNRLARAQVCEGNLKRAEKTYNKVLELDPYNIIAKKNLEKLTKIPKNGGNSNGNGHLNGEGSVGASFSNYFLYEPGKTKIIQLLNLAPPATIASLNCGEKLEMTLKKHSVCIVNSEGTYLGALPDDLSHKLISFIGGGNKYEVYVKYSTSKKLTVFIREVERSTKFENQPSFQTNS